MLLSCWGFVRKHINNIVTYSLHYGIHGTANSSDEISSLAEGCLLANAVYGKTSFTASGDTPTGIVFYSTTKGQEISRLRFRNTCVCAITELNPSHDVCQIDSPKYVSLHHDVTFRSTLGNSRLCPNYELIMKTSLLASVDWLTSTRLTVYKQFQCHISIANCGGVIANRRESLMSSKTRWGS